MNEFKKMLYVAALLALTITVNLSAREVNLDEAIQIALENNKEILISKMNVDKAQAAVDEAFGYALPTVDFSANFMHYVEKPVFFFPDFGALLGNATYDILFNENVLPRDDSKFKPVSLVKQSFVLANSYETSVQVSQILFNSAVFQGIGASQKYLDLSKIALKSNVANTILNVKRAFYGALLTKELLAIMEQSLANAQENLNNVKAMHKQGLVSDYDLMQVEVRVENIRPMVVQMRNTLITATDGLKVTLGLDPGADISVKGEMQYIPGEIPALEQTSRQALESNYDLKTLDYKMKVDEAFIELDRSEYWPTVVAFGNYSYAGQSDDFKFQNYSSALVGLNLSINLFKGGRTHNKVQQSTIALKQTEEQKSQFKDYLVMQIKSTLVELERVKTMLDAQERNVTLAEKAYELSVTRYKEGTGTQLEIQNSDIALQQARTNRLNSVYDYIVAKSNLDKLLGNVETKYLRQFMDKTVN